VARTAAASGVFEVSITVGQLNMDIEDSDVTPFNGWMETYAGRYGWLFATARGGNLHHLHMQGVARLVASSVPVVSNSIKDHMRTGNDTGLVPYLSCQRDWR
jgi:hypothetical protein